MTPSRKCPLVKLSKKPLVLVLCQVRFSQIANIAAYMPKVQDAFRKLGYPIQTQGKSLSIVFGPTTGPRPMERDRWIFADRDEKCSVIVDSEQIVLQTVEYDTFEAYAGRLSVALSAVLKETEHDRLGVVQRIGLRYVDLVRPQKEPTEDFRVYLRQGLHGLADDAFLAGTKRCAFEAMGRTQLAEDRQGTLVVRVHQNYQGVDLPPDLAGDAPKNRPVRVDPGELVTLVDMDHFWEGKQGPEIDINVLMEIAYRLHDFIIITMHEHVVTKEALAIWK